MTSRFHSEFNCEKSSFFEVFRIWVDFGFTFTLDPLVEFLWLELTVGLILMIPISIQISVWSSSYCDLFSDSAIVSNSSEDTSVILVAILEEACAMILLIDTLRLSERFIENQKSVLESKIPYFKKWKTELETRFRADIVGRGCWVILFQPIRMRLMDDEMNQLAFRSRILTQNLECSRL